MQASVAWRRVCTCKASPEYGRGPAVTLAAPGAAFAQPVRLRAGSNHALLTACCEEPGCAHTSALLPSDTCSGVKPRGRFLERSHCASSSGLPASLRLGCPAGTISLHGHDRGE